MLLLWRRWRRWRRKGRRRRRCDIDSRNRIGSDDSYYEFV